MATKKTSAAAPSTQRIGEMLRNAGLITAAQLQAALAMQKKEGDKVGSALVRMGAIDEAVLATFLGMQKGIEAIPLADRRIPKPVLDLISAESAYRHGAIPVARKGSTLSVVLVNPSDGRAIAALTRETGLRIDPAIAPQSSIYSALKRYYADPSTPPPTLSGPAEIRAKLEQIRKLVSEVEALLPR